jgi:erythromycin esterase-like protein
MASATRVSVPQDTLAALSAAMKPIDDVFALVKDAKVVLVGESRRAGSCCLRENRDALFADARVCVHRNSHGTEEFYRARARRTLARARAAALPLLPLTQHASCVTRRAFCKCHPSPGWRCELSKRLIDEAGFAAVCIEGDWPDTYALHTYANAAPEAAPSLDAAFEGFKSRFPLWMWRNPPVLEFVQHLRQRNERLPPEQRAGIFGAHACMLPASAFAC